MFFTTPVSASPIATSSEPFSIIDCGFLFPDSEKYPFHLRILFRPSMLLLSQMKLMYAYICRQGVRDLHNSGYIVDTLYLRAPPHPSPIDDSVHLAAYAESDGKVWGALQFFLKLDDVNDAYDGVKVAYQFVLPRKFRFLDEEMRRPRFAVEIVERGEDDDYGPERTPDPEMDD